MNRLFAITLVISHLGCAPRQEILKDDAVNGLWSFSLPGELRFTKPGGKTTDNYSAVHEVSMDGDLKKLKYLLDNGEDPNKRASAGSTPIIFAAVEGKVNVINMLIQYGAKVNATNDSGYTALDYALDIKNKNTVSFLLKNGAKKGNELQKTENK